MQKDFFESQDFLLTINDKVIFDKQSNMGKDDFRHDLSGFMEKIKEVVEDPIYRTSNMTR